MWRALTSSRAVAVGAALAAASLTLPALAVSLPDRNDTWLAVDSGNFTLLSAAGETVAREAAVRMETAHDLILRLNPGLTPRYRIPTTVIIFRDEASFRRYKSRPDGAVKDVDGLFVSHPLGNYIALAAHPSRDPYPVIYHEYTHYLVGSLLDPLPLWLDEGLAEYYSTLRMTRGPVEVGRPPRAHLLWLSEHPLLPLADLLSISREDDDYNEGTRRGTFYAQSWALVHFLLRDQPARLDRVASLGRLLAAGRSQEDALTLSFGADVHGLNQALRAYVTAGDYRVVTVAARETPPRAQPAVRMARYSEVVARLGAYLTFGHMGRDGLARAHLRAALKEDPSEVTALLASGALYAGERRFDEAIEAYEAALQVDPSRQAVNGPLGQVLLARAMLATPQRMPLADHLRPTAPLPADLARARSLLRAATGPPSRQAESLVSFGYTFLRDPGDVTEGIAALTQAQALLPERTDVIYNLGVLHLRAGHRAAASALFDQIAALAPGSDMAAQVARIELFEALREIDTLLATGDLEAGQARLTALRRQTTDVEMLDAIDARLDRLDAVRSREHDRARLEVALAFARDGRDPDAARMLRAIVAETRDEAIRAEARRLLRRIVDRSRHLEGGTPPS
ncbi:MAG: tetratricopeptide repeat protein [Acidobacteriota bacterium]